MYMVALITINQNADVNAEDETFYTTLIVVAGNGHRKIFEMPLNQNTISMRKVKILAPR